MITPEKAQELFRAHAAVTKCKVCQEFAKEDGYVSNCPCGWDLAQAVLASDNPDVDVLVMEVVDELDEHGWNFSDKLIKPTGRVITGRPPFGLADRIVQITIGSDGTSAFAVLVNREGWMRGFVLKDRTVEAVEKLIVETAEAMPTLSAHEVEDAVAEMVQRITT